GGRLDGALHLAGLEARGAHVQALGSPGDHGTHALDVRVPATLGAAVRVRDRVPEGRALATDVAVGSHDDSPDQFFARGRRGLRATIFCPCSGNRTRVPDAG